MQIEYLLNEFILFKEIEIISALLCLKMEMIVEDTVSHPIETEGKNGNKKDCLYFNGVEISKLSKRQMKKYKKCLKWQEVKKEKRLKERIRMKERRKYQKLNNIDMGPSRKELKKRPKMEDSPCKISVCIDLSFDNLMIDKVRKIV